MKNFPANILVAAALTLSIYSVSAQSAQSQNSNQNTTPTHYGTDPNNANPAPQQGNPISNPGNNTAPGSKPVNGSYGNPVPVGTTGPSGNNSSPNINNGATGSSGHTEPQRYNGSEHQRSPQ